VSTDDLATGAFLLYAVCLGALALASSPVLVFVLLAAAGSAWLGLLSTLNAMAQLMLPEWVRGRALAYFIVVVGGSQALGGAVWGVVASLFGLRVTFLAAAGVLAVLAAVARRFPVLDPTGVDSSPSVRHLPSEVDAALDAEDGPVLVTVDYRVRIGDVDDFRHAMSAVARMRRRTGARRWGLFWDPASPQRFLETFVVASWGEHRRQHLGRMTVLDRALVGAIDPYLDRPVEVSHLVAVDVSVATRSHPSTRLAERRRGPESPAAPDTLA
jgi:MFS family permease